MRFIFGIIFAFTIAACNASHVRADPYRWCAQYERGGDELLFRHLGAVPGCDFGKWRFLPGERVL